MLRTHCRDNLLRLSQMQPHGGRLLSREWQRGRCAGLQRLPCWHADGLRQPWVGHYQGNDALCGPACSPARWTLQRTMQPS